MKTNSTVETVLARRSIRSFVDKPLPHDELETIAICAKHAPSANNRQEWMFFVIEDRNRTAKLAAVIGEAMGRATYDMYKPQALIMVAHKKDAPFGREDDGCAMENIMLAAQSFGIGSVWINQLQGLCEIPAVRAHLTELGVPEDYEVHGMAALGYAAKEPPELERTSPVIWIGSAPSA
ncbi:nitroreductase family protein [Raoultibacter phocaeensis]|uniref:nitroreductase family protein n=1 Tax=Raoultibacter phocaeensis TaxID=2479841 RepID=UPI00111A011E|nr:nitroreductase [Raoultibacter phocaeensis]